VSLAVGRITPELKIEDVQDNRKLHPVNKISSIFCEALADEHIHVLVQRPTGALLEFVLTCASDF